MYPLKHLKDWGKTLSKRTDKGKIKLLKSKYQLKIPGEKLPENAPEYDMFAIGWMDKKVITCLFNVGTTAVVEDLKRMRSKRQLLEDGSGYETVKYFKVVPIVDVMARLFKYFPKVDIHDHYRQGSLSFHTYWPTKTWWHRLYSNILGIIIVDAYFMYRHDQLRYDRDEARLLTFSSFIDVLAYELLTNTTGQVDDRVLRDRGMQEDLEVTYFVILSLTIH
jgi:hypothetical protein